MLIIVNDAFYVKAIKLFRLDMTISIVYISVFQKKKTKKGRFSPMPSKFLEILHL